MIPLIYLGAGIIVAYLLIGRTTADTTKDKEKAYNVLTAHSDIKGFGILATLLQEDNFLTNEPYKPPPNIPNTLSIGTGKGETNVSNVDLFLREMTAEKLNRITRKSLRHETKADSVNDRIEVLTWITADIPLITNYDLLVRDLTLINWASTSPSIPPNAKLDPRLSFSANGKTIKKIDYPNFILHATTDDILSMTNALLDPHDSTEEERQFTYLLAESGALGGVVGFSQFIAMLDYNGFIKSPQQFNIPKLLPNPLVLGGSSLSSKQLIELFTNGRNSEMNATIVQALNTYDSTLKDRLASLATLKLVMNNFKGEAGYPSNFETVYNWLISSGFATSPRKFTPIPNPPQNFTARSFGWVDIPDVNNWLQTVSYQEVDAFNDLASIPSHAYTKYLAYKTTQIININISGLLYTSLPDLAYTNDGIPYTPPTFDGFANYCTTLYANGLMYSPSRLPSSTTFFGMGTKQFATNDMMNKDDEIFINFWIGKDPKGTLGILQPTDINGNKNPYFSPWAQDIANILATLHHEQIIQP